jgi:hypothetical protein
VFYLPYYYEVQGIDRLGQTGAYYSHEINLPYFRTNVSQGEFVWLAAAVGMAYLVATTLTLSWAAAQFDHWTGRARQRSG